MLHSAGYIQAYGVHIDVGTQLGAEVQPCAFELRGHGDPNQCFTLISYGYEYDMRRARTVVTQDFLVPLLNTDHTATLHIEFFLTARGEEWFSEFSLDLYGFPDAPPPSPSNDDDYSMDETM